MRFLYVLGVLNALIASILMWLATLALVFIGQVEDLYVTKELFLVVRFKPEGWFFKKVFTDRQFSGFSMGNTIWMSDNPSAYTEAHEAEHCRQSYILGIFFLPVYLGNSLYIYFFQKDKHSYYDNYFEKKAREAAGQQVEIPREQWNNPKDRWIFW